MNTLSRRGKVPNGVLRREGPLKQSRNYRRSDLNSGGLSFLDIRQSTADCERHLQNKCLKSLKHLEKRTNVMEIEYSTCSDCLWRQKELRMTKADYKELKSCKTNGKTPILCI